MQNFQDLAKPKKSDVINLKTESAYRKKCNMYNQQKKVMFSKKKNENIGIPKK